MKDGPVKEETGARPTAKKIFGTLLLAILALAVLTGVFYLKENLPERTPGPAKKVEGKNELSSVELSRKPVPLPYIKTDIPSVAYTADNLGNIEFYRFGGKSYEKIDETGKMELTVPLSGQKIPVCLHYIEQDGILTGFGLFTPAASSAEVYIYKFVMFRVADLPAAYKKEGKCLLLAHTDIGQAYSDNAVWEEAYVLNRADGSTERFLSENNRALDINGAVRPDFCRLTDTELDAPTPDVPFFSSRSYDQQPEQGATLPTDIYIKNGSSEKIAVKGVLDTYAKPLNDGGFVYIRKAEEGFETVKYLNGKSTAVHVFYGGAYGDTHIRNGDWILAKEDGRIYRTYDDTVLEPQGYKLNPLLFAVSPDGKYAAMLGTSANAKDYQLYICNTETGAYRTFTDSSYAAHNNLRFIDDATLTFHVASITASAIFENAVVDVSGIK